MKVELISPEQTYDLRHKILRPNQDMVACHYPGDHTGTTFHLGVIEKEKVISIGSFYREIHTEFKDPDQYRLRGMATDAEFRKKGYGTLLISEAERILRERSVKLLWCYARQKAFDFYERVGMKFHGPLFQIDGIGPHKVMYKKI